MQTALSANSQNLDWICDHIVKLDCCTKPYLLIQKCKLIGVGISFLAQFEPNIRCLEEN